MDAWFSHPKFIKLVEQEWKNVGSMDAITKFKRLKALIRKWNKQVFGNIDGNIQKFEMAVAEVEYKTESNGAEEVDLS